MGLMADEIPDRVWVQLVSDDESVSLSARHAIAVFYQYLVEGCARKLESRLPSWITDEDLMSAGQLGLLKAIDRYDRSKGPFSKFASSAIHGAIIDDLRSQDWAPRSLRQSQREITRAQRHLSATGSQPSLSDIAKHLGWDQAKVESTLRKVEVADVMHIAYQDADSQGQSTVQLVCALFVRDYRKLPGAVQVVLARIYFLNQTLTEVAAEMGLPLPTVRRLHMDGVQAATECVAGSLLST